LDRLQRIAGADDGRHAQLAGDDRGVAGAAAAAGDDGRGAPPHRLPVWVGYVGDQHVAGPHALHVLEPAHHAGDGAADLVADRAALGDALAALVERVALDLGGLGARLHGLRARLDDEQLAADAVLRPLDVHRAAVVLLDGHRLAGELVHLLVRQREAVAQFARRVLGAHALARRVGVRHPDRRGAEGAAQDRVPAGLERGLVAVVLVRVHRSLDDQLAQAVARGDEYHVAEARFG